MFSIYGDKVLYQWDRNQKIVVSDRDIPEVHFATAISQKALVVKCVEDNGLWVAAIPSSLLTEGRKIFAYAFDGDNTVIKQEFKVMSREKPDDYVTTDDEISRYTDLDKRIAALEEEAGGTVEIDLSNYRTLDNNIYENGVVCAGVCDQYGNVFAAGENGNPMFWIEPTGAFGNQSLTTFTNGTMNINNNKTIIGAFGNIQLSPVIGYEALIVWDENGNSSCKIHSNGLIEAKEIKVNGKNVATMADVEAAIAAALA